MLPELYKLMTIYVRHIQQQFAKPEEEALFVTNEGITFRESTIGKRLTAFVSKCGVNLTGCMAFVDMHKVITTEMIKRASLEERDILRRVLAHSKKTSKPRYSQPDLTETGIQMVRVIKSLLDPKEKAKFSVEPGSSGETVKPVKSQPASSSAIKNA